MIQFNLLPDVKLQYVKANKLKRLVVVVSSIAAAGLLGIMLLLLVSVKVVQANHIKNLNSQISAATASLKSTPNLSQVLTVQNQLSALTALHESKPVVSRLPGYISQLTPATATISELQMDFMKNTMTITGTADSLTTINQYVDTIKLATFTTGPKTTPQKAFSQVTLAQFGDSTQNGPSYEIIATFNPAIFSGAYDTVTLSVPTQTTTRTELGEFTNLFETQPQATTSNSSSSSDNSAASSSNGSNQ